MPVRVTRGSTGKLFAQIANGAPYDVFFAADAARPRQAVESRLAVGETRITYARGRLAVYGELGSSDGAAALRSGVFRNLAVAHPETAPYGAAALEVLEHLGLLELLRPRLVHGQSVGHAAHYVDSGAAELGLVALSQVIRRDGAKYWSVPEEMHEPIVQQAVVLRDAAAPEAARRLLEFMRRSEAAAILIAYGYSPD